MENYEKHYREIEKLTDNPFLNLYHIDALGRDGMPFHYYFASRNGEDNIKHKTHSLRPEGMAVYAVTEDGQHLVLVRQYRYPMDDYLYELPAGLIEPGETASEAACREMIEDNIQEIGLGVASDAIRHRFFLVFQYEARMKAKRNTVSAIVQRLNEEADTARRYLDVCELEVLEPRYADDFILKLLYEIINKKTSRRVRLPEGVFDMTTAVHGIYEE